MWAVFKKFAKPIALGHLLGIFSALVQITYPKLIGTALDHITLHRPWHQILIYLSLLFAFQAAMSSTKEWLLARVSIHMGEKLRLDFYAQILKLNPLVFYKTPSGDWLNRLHSDIALIQTALSHHIGDAIRHLLLSIGVLLLSAFYSPALTLGMALIIPPVVISSLWLGKIVRTLSRKIQSQWAFLNQLAKEALDNLETVQILKRQGKEWEHYRASLNLIVSKVLLKNQWQAFWTGSVYFMSHIALVIMLYFGGKAVQKHQITLGDLSALCIYALIFAMALSGLARAWAGLMVARGAAQRVFPWLHAQNPCEQSLVQLSFHSLELKNISFAYKNQKKILHKLSLHLDKGEKIGIYGPSGSGKSTLIKVILGLYPIQNGQFFLNGHPIRQDQLQNIANLFGVVPQDPVLFSTSILQNIQYGNPSASFEEIQKVLQKVQLWDWIQSMPNHWHTQVGERGLQISMGQRQRIALARALIANPQILVLDEPITALDPKNQQVIFKLLSENRTVLLVTHRRPLLKALDRYCKMIEGRLVASSIF